MRKIDSLAINAARVEAGWSGRMSPTAGFIGLLQGCDTVCS